MGELQAVLFDMDGTLVETESLWHEAEVLTMALWNTWRRRLVPTQQTLP